MSLPMFPPGDGPGPSFTELLHRVGLDPPTAQAQGGSPPMQLRHGTTIVALRYGEGVVMAGDRRAAGGPTLAPPAPGKGFQGRPPPRRAPPGAARAPPGLGRALPNPLAPYEKVAGVAPSPEG